MSWFDDLKASVGGIESDINSAMPGIKNTAAGAIKGVSDMAGTATGFVRDAQSTVGKLSNDLSSLRLGAAGLLGKASGVLGLIGSTARVTQSTAQWLSAGGAGANQCVGGSSEDWRVKVSVAPGMSFMDSPLLAPLSYDGGVTFPILPQVQVTHTAKYTSQSLTHSNYAAQSYEGSEVAEIQINGEFPIQNIVDGRYLLAVIYFFRTSTKMFWGKDALAGTPPPLLYLDGFGTHYFPHVPCVLKSFTHVMPPDVDYIEVPTTGAAGVTRLPTQSSIQIALQPVYSRAKVASFSLNDFAAGKMVTGSGGPGGFI